MKKNLEFFIPNFLKYPGMWLLFLIKEHWFEKNFMIISLVVSDLRS